MAENTPEIIFQELKGSHGDVGLIVLNRPQALNALTQTMCVEMSKQLEAWAQKHEIKGVVIRGAGEKAFCAGGDIRRIYELGREGDLDRALNFFQDEYRNNYRIFTYEKPFIAFMDGITMGGGVGISIHGSHRIVTERTLFAMPETGIGFFPDVGGSYFLPRCEDEFGTYLALTGARLSAASLMDAKLGDAAVMSHHLDELLNALLEKNFGHHPHEAVNEVLKQFSISIEPSSDFKTHRAVIKECFAHEEVESILDALNAHHHPWCEEVIAQLSTKSPSSLKITLKQLRQGVSLDMAACLDMEYGLCQHFLKSKDFYEGVRAQLVDKDKNPRWDPPQLKEVTEEAVSQYFSAEKHLSFS